MLLPRYTFFLLSPANLGGARARLVTSPAARFPLAEALRSAEGAPLGAVFSFVSGLYFRGKATYAEAFGRAPPGISAGLVISPAEGLHFLTERVTLERLRRWAEVPVGCREPRFTRPLIEHAAALARTFGAEARVVLLGSIATDKYVQPLLEVFGAELLFPRDFVGRGDMSRGALMLQAARSGVELEYAPVVGAERHGRRAAPGARARRAAPCTAPEMVVLVGLPGAGKTTFFRQRFGATHEHISKDNFRRHRRPARRQAELVEAALSAGRPLVVDNTNASAEERAPLLEAARRHGARVRVYLFTATAAECLVRNARRAGVERVPEVAIFAAHARFARPGSSEGFDELYRVSTLPAGGFEVTPEQ